MMDNQFVVFKLGAEDFGVKISAVESIIKMQTITSMPNSPVFVEGVTNLRGKVVPVIDLRRRFCLEKQKSDRNSRTIVVHVNQTEVGMIVDSVSEVLTIPEEVIEPAPAIATTIDSSFITGLAKIDQRLVILLDLAEILSIQEQESLAGVSSGL